MSGNAQGALRHADRSHFMMLASMIYSPSEQLAKGVCLVKHDSGVL